LLSNEASILAAVEYIRRQPNPLVIWIRDAGLIVPSNAAGAQRDGEDIHRPA
jgi:hypothetical protein